MPTFKAPTYSKVTQVTTGKTDSCYTFSIFFSAEEERLCFIAEKKEDICLQSLQQCVIEHMTWWNHFVHQYLQASSIFFSKQYQIDHINRIAKHQLTGKDTGNYPCNVVCTPSMIQITGSQFVVHWEYVMKAMVIDIPDLEEEKVQIELSSNKLPDLEDDSIVQGLQELNMDQVPMDKNSTEETLEVDNPVKFFDKQRVKEARLKAKLALYKANRQIAKYYDKYGVNDITESESESESEWESSEEEEDVQL